MISPNSYRFSGYVLCTMLAVALFATDAAALTVQNVSQSASSVPVYEKFEVRFELDQSYSNPYDPDIVDASFTFTGPSGTPRTIPAFWHGTLPGFMARLAPVETGAHTGVIRVRDNLGGFTTHTVAFTATAPNGPGFIYVDSRSPRHLRHSNGQPFHPIGHNIGWGMDTPNFIPFLDKMQAAGANWTRHWMANPGLAIEWGGGYPPEYAGLGNYYPLKTSQWDDAIEAARSRGIYQQMCLHSFTSWNYELFDNWHENPYNSALGGMLNRPIDYFTNAQARKLAKQRFRYIVARWSYSTSVMCWELWNEVDIVGVGGAANETYQANEQAAANWHAEMGAYLKSIDPYDHLVTTSFADSLPEFPNDPYDLIWMLPEMDIVQQHTYSGILPGDHIKLLLRRRNYGKNVLIGEGNLNGVPSNKPSLKDESPRVPSTKDLKYVDGNGQSIHDLIWPAALHESGSMSWWWGGWIDDNNLYYNYTPLRNFMQGEDWAPQQLQPIDQSQPGPVTIQADPGGTTVWGSYGPENAYLWFLNYGGGVSGFQIRIASIQPGDYTAEYWNTYVGNVAVTDPVTADGNGLVLNVPFFNRDMAVKIKPVAQPVQPHWQAY